MNYQKIYDNLILSRKNRSLEKDEYYEKHHIVPKCLNGSNDEDNLVHLTYREHYMAHLLLTKIYKHHSGINYALLCMIRKHSTGERIITSKIYQNIKRNYTKFKKYHCNMINPGKTENSRSAARKRMLERNPISLDPSKNRTAQPVRIYYEDGTTEDFKYAKEFCIKNGVSYATMKYWLKKGNVISKKHKITKVEKINKEKA